MAVLLRCSFCSANVFAQPLFSSRKVWNGLPVLREHLAILIHQSKVNQYNRNLHRLITSGKKANTIRKSPAGCIYVDKSIKHKNFTPSWRSVCGMQGDESKRQLDKCYGGIEFRDLVYDEFVKEDFRTEDLAKKLLEYEKTVAGQFAKHDRVFHYFREQNLFPDERIFSDLNSTPEFKSLLDYIHSHLDEFNPNDLTSMCYSLAVLNVNTDHPVIADMFMKIQETGEINFQSLWKLQELFSSLRPTWLSEELVLTKFQHLLEERGFLMSEDDEENLCWLKTVNYNYVLKSSLRNSLLHKVLEMVTSGDVLERHPLNIALCFTILATYRRAENKTDENLVKEIMSQCMRRFLQTADKLDLDSLCEICMSMIKLFVGKPDFFFEFKSKSQEHVLKHVKKILVQKEDISFSELRLVMPCVSYVADICDDEIWYRLRCVMEDNIDNFTKSNLQKAYFVIGSQRIPGHGWFHIAEASKLIILNKLMQIDPEMYSDIFDDANVFRKQCWMVGSKRMYRFPVLKYIILKLYFVEWLTDEREHSDDYEFAQKVAALMQFSILDKGMPEKFYQKILRAIPAWNVKALNLAIKGIDYVSLSCIKGKVFPKQYFEIQVAIFESLMEQIDSAENIEKLFEIESLFFHMPYVKVYRFAAVVKLLDKVEEECSKNLTYAVFCRVLEMLHVRCQRIYRPKLLEILLNYCLDNHPIIEVKDYLLLFHILKISSLKINRREEFCDLMITFTDEVFDSLPLVQQIMMLKILASLQIFPKDYLKKVFSFQYLQNLDVFLSENAEFSKEVSLNVMQLNRCVVLECPELNQTWFHDSIGSAYPTENVSSIHTRCQMFLEDILGGKKFVCPDVQTHYLYMIDFECLLMSPDNTPVSYPELKEKPHLSKYVQRVAVNFLDKDCYHSDLNSRKLLCDYLMKRRHLELLGYKVVEIPYYEWNSMALSREEFAKEYLKEKIFD